ncbi:MAG: TonB-dependent receptor family protein [Chitinophaga sp.]|uniref:outer membrane beta-barrel family protein n=1 Tax=Chitinophaga sp. TaxID=1869181 RepID=UPI0025BB9E55|nr:outer membrane beta-barrel family protein [Chitinophaga sp.]MBV8252051.1 TonB-dependent receptor family protein [Chitinophaga sp.]
MKSLFPILCLLICARYTLAQESPHPIKVVVVSPDSVGIEGVTVKINQNGKELVSLTNGKGETNMLLQQKAAFTVSLSHIGFNALIAKREGVNNQSLLTFVLTPNSKDLKGVEIVAEKPLITMDQNKIILSIDKNKVAGQSVVDILKKAPGISIQNNMILFEGKPITAQMKGKTIQLSAAVLTDFLGATAAAGINEIEIITVPLANMDASITSAVVNLKPARLPGNGYNTNMSLKIGTREIFGNGGIGASVNFKHNKFSGLVNLNYAWDYQLNKGEVTRHLIPTMNSKTTGITENNYSKSTPENMPLSISLEYAINRKSQLGTVINGMLSNTPTDRYSASSVFVHNQPPLPADSLVTMNAGQHKKNQFGAIDVYYKLKLDSLGQELSMNAAYSKVHGTSDNRQQYDYFLQDGSTYQQSSFLNQDALLDLTTKSIQADYIRLLGKVKFESGLKYGWTTVDQQLNQTIINKNGTTHLIDDPVYKENIFAGYASISGALAGISYSLGIRGENTAIKSLPLEIYGSNNTSYFKLFPALMLSKKYRKHSLVLTYKKSIERPKFYRLTNFKNYTSPFYYYTGNPALQPYFQNATRLAWTIANKFQVTASYTWYKNNMLEYEDLDTINNVTRGLIANNGTFKNISLSPGYFGNITRWWYTNSGFRITQKYIRFVTNGETVSIDNTSYGINISNTFTISKSMKCEMYAYYSSPTYFSASRTDPFYFLDISLYKNILKGAGQVSLSVSDIFYTNINKTHAQYALISFDSRTRWDSRNIVAGFNYRFGSKNYKSSQLRKGSAADDIKSRSY